MDDSIHYSVQSIFGQFSLIPDYILLLQQNSDKFEYNNWIKKIKSIPKENFSKKYIYSFIKIGDEQISAIYIGISKVIKKKRLLNHVEGLHDYEINKSNIDKSLYPRFYHKMFEIDKKLPIYLVIFNWDESRIIEKIFPFNIEVNYANAEALLISTFSYEYRDAIINHDYVSRTKWASKKLSLDNINQNILKHITGGSALDLWENFCEVWFLNENLTLENNESNINLHHIPLFKKDENNIVSIYKRGSNNIKIFKKSQRMTKNIENACKIIKNSYDYYSNENISLNKKINERNPPLFTDGLNYMVYTLKSELDDIQEFQEMEFQSEYIPIYIGKTETLGRNGGYSANLKGVHKGKNPSYFARWGHDDARHMGGLSLRFFNIPNTYPSTDYEKWIKIIFNDKARNERIPKLKFPVFFKMKPWFPYNISFNNKIGIFTPELESYLIALCRTLFPNFLSNKQNR